MDASWIHFPSSFEMAVQAGVCLYVYDLVRKTRRYTREKIRQRQQRQQQQQYDAQNLLLQALEKGDEIVPIPLRKAA